MSGRLLQGSPPTSGEEPTPKRQRAAPSSSLDVLSEYALRTYRLQRILGKGTFGVVCQCHVEETGETVAVKCIDTPEKDREVQILKELNGHPNIVRLKGAFRSEKGAKLNLVFEFLSDTLHRVIKHYNMKGHRKMDPFYYKLYQYQLLRGLAFMHGTGIIHVDIKPQNLLLIGSAQTLKICDFGTAKRLNSTEPRQLYQVSRYFRAPEIILGSTVYGTGIDIWAAGCVLGEMVLGQPLFTGRDGIDQLLEIMKVLGTPSSEELHAMNPNYPRTFVFSPRVQPYGWDVVTKKTLSREGCELMGKLVCYDPQARAPAHQSLLHGFFDVLREDEKPNTRQLFNFSEEELNWFPKAQRSRLFPSWITPTSTS